MIGLGLVAASFAASPLALSAQASGNVISAELSSAASTPRFGTALVSLGSSAGPLTNVPTPSVIIPRWSRIVDLIGGSAEILDLVHHRVVAAVPVPAGATSIVRDDARGRVFVVGFVANGAPRTIEAIDVRSGRRLFRHQMDPNGDTFIGVDSSTGNLIGVEYGNEFRIVSPDGHTMARHPLASDITPSMGDDYPVLLLDLPHHVALFCKPVRRSQTAVGESNPTTIAASDTRTGAQLWEHSVGFPPALCAVNARTGQVWAVALGGHVRLYDDRSGRLAADIRMAYPTPDSWASGLSDDGAQTSISIDEAANVGYIVSARRTIDRADPRSHQRRIFHVEAAPPSFQLPSPVIMMFGTTSNGDMVYDFNQNTFATDGRSGALLGRWTLSGDVTDDQLLGSASDASHVYAVNRSSVSTTNDVSGTTLVPALRIDAISF